MMTLDEFIKKLRNSGNEVGWLATVELFEADWRSHQTDALAKLNWPDELEDEEAWDDQFLSFLRLQGIID